jgi:hypothetical protein
MTRDDQKFLAVPPDIQTDQPAGSKVDCEQLYLLLNAYRFGAINFLELLDAYEEALGLQPQASEKDDAA